MENTKGSSKGTVHIGMMKRKLLRKLCPAEHEKCELYFAEKKKKGGDKF